MDAEPKEQCPECRHDAHPDGRCKMTVHDSYHGGWIPCYCGEVKLNPKNGRAPQGDQ